MLNRLYGWYGKRVVWGALALLALLLVAGFIVHKSTSEEAPAAETRLPQVEVRTVSELQSESNFSVVGTVRAVSEARLETEAGGRVTSVSAGIGDRVAAGTVLATIENSSERAALLQAEGAYESALATSLQSGSSFEESQVAVRNASRDAFSTTENIVRNVIDQFFSNPTSGIAGFRISGTGNALEYITTRRSIEDTLVSWSAHVTNNFMALSEEQILSETEKAVRQVADFTATLAGLVADEDNKEEFTDEERAEYQGELASARASLDGALASVSQARNAYEQAKISAAEGNVSQAGAQLKSALGTLRSAQANYEKTLIRTPIAGVVNALYLKAGEYTQAGEPAAVVANNGSLEVTTALSEEDLESVHVGDTVRVGDATGTIARIAPAVDPLSGKAEVRVSLDTAESLKNGSTVSVTFSRATRTEANEPIVIPLSAVKLLPSGPVAFSVNSEGMLVAHTLTLGEIKGDAVEIADGLSTDEMIVRDVRGLKAGDTVEVVGE